MLRDAFDELVELLYKATYLEEINAPLCTQTWVTYILTTTGECEGKWKGHGQRTSGGTSIPAVEHESALTCRVPRINLGAASKSRAPRYAAPWYQRGWEYCRRQVRSREKGYAQGI